MPEQLVQWKPIENLCKKYYIDSIISNVDGFEILLSDTCNANKKVRLLFPDGIDVYTFTDKNFSRDRFNAIQEQYGSEFCTEWTFFKVLNSQYALLLSEESYNFYKADDFTHFVFVAVDSILDIVNPTCPTIEFFNEPSSDKNLCKIN